MDKHLLELYGDYLLSSFGATTATGLSALVDGAVSHDQVTRFLLAADYDGRTRWPQVKPLVRDIQQADGVLIVDDTIQAKPHRCLRVARTLAGARLDQRIRLSGPIAPAGLYKPRR